VDRLHVEDSCRTARSSPTCPSLQSLVNALFHLVLFARRLLGPVAGPS
jgi:hypothetical protein